MINIDLWCIGTIFLFIFIIITIVIILTAFFKKIQLKKPKKWFDENENLKEQKNRLLDHQDRIIGTLMFWKNKAELYNRLHIARIYWGLISSIIIPVLLQFFDKNNIWANAFMTILTTWTAIIVGLAQILKAEEKYRGYRQCESDYYDLSRELLDNLPKDESELKKTVDEYLEITSQIRKIGRVIETDSTISVRTSQKYSSKQ